MAAGHIPPYYHPYSICLAALYYIIGPNIIVPKLINCILASASVALGVVVVGKIAESFGEGPTEVRRRQKACGAMLALYPSALFYSTQMIKDSAILFAGNLLLFATLELTLTRRTTRRPGRIALIGASLLALGIFRPYCALSMVSGICLFVLVGSGLSIVKKMVFISTAFAVAYLAPAAAGVGPFAFDLWGSSVSDVSGLEKFRQEKYSSQSSSVGIELDYTSPDTFIPSYAYAVATVLCGPFPWQILNNTVLIAEPEAILMWCTIPFFFRRRTVNGVEVFPKVSAPLLVALIGFCMLAFIGDNLGANTRLRWFFWNLLIIHLSAMTTLPAFFAKWVLGSDRLLGVTPQRNPLSAPHVVKRARRPRASV
jgi:hypothetical protein